MWNRRGSHMTQYGLLLALTGAAFMASSGYVSRYVAGAYRAYGLRLLNDDLSRTSGAGGSNAFSSSQSISGERDIGYTQAVDFGNDQSFSRWASGFTLATPNLMTNTRATEPTVTLPQQLPFTNNDNNSGS
jgi:hypothetical protein